MTDYKKLELARTWARTTAGVSMKEVHAAEDVILSLPDEWVDAEKLRELLGKWDGRDLAPDAYLFYREVEALLPTTPRPEDVPVGEAWQVEVEGRAAIGYRNDPEHRFCWAVMYRDDASHGWPCDNDVTLIARLVPETTEQDDEPAFDPAFTYRDNHGDEWKLATKVGRWVCETRKGHTFHVEHDPPAEHGPYTRIEAYQ